MATKKGLTRSELVRRVSEKTDYSESHVTKVLAGYRINEQILKAARSFKRGFQPGTSR